jgi:hypothetical protein
VPPLSHLTSCTPTKANLYFDIYFVTVMSEPALYRLLTFHIPNFISIFLSLCHLSKESVQVRGPLWHFVTNCFLRWGVVSPRLTSTVDDHPLSAVRHCLFNIWGYPPYLEAVSSIRNLRTHHAMVTKRPTQHGSDFAGVSYFFSLDSLVHDLIPPPRWELNWSRCLSQK